MRLLAVTGLVLATFFGPSSTQAAISVFIDDPLGFETSRQASEYGILGFEDFEDNIVADGTTVGIGSPLSPSSIGTFPNGISVPMEMTSNSGLRATKNRGNVVGTVVGGFSNTTSMDLNFAAEDAIKAVSFNPVTPFSDAARFSVFVGLYGGASTSFNLNPVDAAGSHYVGIHTDLFDSPIRIISLGFGLINGTFTPTNNGIDNVTLYTVPEPTALLIHGLLFTAGLALNARSRLYEQG